MKKTIVITDLTRMHEGRVCIAGYDSELSCLRPVLPHPGILEGMLAVSATGPIVFPSARVEFDFGHPTPHPPHTEDIVFMPKSIRFAGRLDGEQWRKLLSSTLSKCVESIFEQDILVDHGAHVREGRGIRSLGTLLPSRITNAVYRPRKESKWEYRLGFDDQAATDLELPVTDFARRYYLEHQRAKGRVSSTIAVDMAELLARRTVYLRIGLARGWADHPEECYLQITGVHTFPDYLLGLTFADYDPKAIASEAKLTLQLGAEATGPAQRLRLLSCDKPRESSGQQIVITTPGGHVAYVLKTRTLAAEYSL